MDSEVVDVFDPVRAEGSSMVHLAPYNWDTRGHSATLCDLKISPTPPGVTFQRDGCFRCARHAISVGIGAFRENEKVVVYLSRFLEKTSAD